MKKYVLGIKIDDINLDQAVETVTDWLKKGGETQGKHYIVTPNPELVVLAQKDEELKEIINNSSLAIPDGVGLKLSGDIVCNTTGVDLMERLIELANDQGFTVGFLGGREGVAEKCVERLRSRYPNLKVSFDSDGGNINAKGEFEKGSSMQYAVCSIEGKKQKKTNTLHTIYSIPNTDFLFVAFGQPKQEKWIYQNLSKIPVKVTMGVGGAFDYLSGIAPRAPKFLRNLGLEWLFRLMIQPWRIKRQLRLVRYLWFLIRFPSSGK